MNVAVRVRAASAGACLGLCAVTHAHCYQRHQVCMYGAPRAQAHFYNVCACVRVFARLLELLPPHDERQLRHHVCTSGGVRAC